MKTLTLILTFACGLAFGQAPVEGCPGCTGPSCAGCHAQGEWDWGSQSCWPCGGGGFNITTESSLNPRMLAEARKRFSKSLTNHGLEVAILSSAMDFLRPTGRLNVSRIAGHSNMAFAEYMKSRNGFGFCRAALSMQTASIEKRLADWSRN